MTINHFGHIIISYQQTKDKQMKYQLTFPSNWTFNYRAVMLEVTKTLRDLCPELGVEEANDMVDQGGTHVVEVGDHLLDTRLLLESLETLRLYGVHYEVRRAPGLVLPYQAAEPEPDIQRTVKTDTLDSLRTAAHDALDRGDHDIAIALIELIKKNS